MPGILWVPASSRSGRNSRHGLLDGLAAGAALQKRGSFLPFAAQQHAGALRAVKSFMARHGDKGSPQGSHVQRQDPCRLGGVHDQGNAPLAAQRGDVLHRLYKTEDIGNVIADHRVCIRCDHTVKGLRHCCRLEQRSRGHVDLGTQSSQRPGDGVVLVSGYHCLSPRRYQTFDGKVQGMGGVEGKDHLLRTPHAVQLRQFVPASKGGIGGPHGRRIPAPARGTHGSKCIFYGSRHCGGFLKRGGCAVKVDHGSTSR